MLLVMPNPIPSPLGGEADLNTWDFEAGNGPLPNPMGHTFPLLKHDAEGQWRLIGTGFYISNEGLFVTAKHVIDDLFEGDRQIASLAIMHPRSESGLFGAQEYLIRRIIQCWLGDIADIALGVAARATNNLTRGMLSHWSWPLTWSVPSVGTAAATYAFPRSPNRADGRRPNYFLSA
ncbi:MAG: serine protease [Pseudomonadota bacterium]|nr:serine protease [Pseudomonadota bacterium]